MNNNLANERRWEEIRFELSDIRLLQRSRSSRKLELWNGKAINASLFTN
jgi:hypothetical protein